MSDHDPLRCTVCLEKFDEKELIPRILSACGHTICNSCLNRLLTMGNVPNGIECPTCRGVTQLNSVSDLKKNFSVLEMVLAQAPQTEAPGTAGKCAQCSKTMIAFFCDQCDTDYCEKCYNKIHSLKVFQSHEKIPIAEKPYQLPKCDVHPKERAEYFCKTCETKQLICGKCFFESHQNHSRGDASEIMKANEGELEDAHYSNNSWAQDAETLNEKLSEIKASYVPHRNNKYYQETKNEIRKHYEKKLENAMMKFDKFTADQYKRAEEQEKEHQIPESKFNEVEQVQKEIESRMSSKQMYDIKELTERSSDLRKDLKRKAKTLSVKDLKVGKLEFYRETLRFEDGDVPR